MIRRVVALAAVLFVVPVVPAFTTAAAGKVDGTFVVAGKDAQLKYVRAVRTKLDEKGRMGFALLLSARSATGDIAAWRTAQPSERGSFIVLLLEQTGGVWVAELGHAAAKSGRFGVVSEVKTSGFKVTGDQLTVTVRTDGEQQFTDDRYSINLKVDATIEQ
jgi:hypothetical protein